VLEFGGIWLEFEEFSPVPFGGICPIPVEFGGICPIPVEFGGICPIGGFEKPPLSLFIALVGGPPRLGKD
jgi:hypothetical protein